MDDMYVCRVIGADKIEMSILMLTAKVEEYDRINKVELGADDYLKKSFSVRELVVRIKAILRRIEKQASHLFHIFTLPFDSSWQNVTRNIVKNWKEKCEEVTDLSR